MGLSFELAGLLLGRWILCDVEDTTGEFSSWHCSHNLLTHACPPTMQSMMTAETVSEPLTLQQPSGGRSEVWPS